MIPVRQAPEPAHFDSKVRSPGNKWLESQKFSIEKPVPPKTTFPAHWTKICPDLRKAYSGICAYCCIYFETVLGADSVDHFHPKSLHWNLAYEWSNYRFSCLGKNRKKGTKTILDPFTLPDETFHLSFLSGKIIPNPNRPALLIQQALETIESLDLNSKIHCRMRADHFTRYISKEWNESYLCKNSPFVWLEIKRQYPTSV